MVKKFCPMCKNKLKIQSRNNLFDKLKKDDYALMCEVCGRFIERIAKGNHLMVHKTSKSIINEINKLSKNTKDREKNATLSANEED